MLTFRFIKFWYKEVFFLCGGCPDFFSWRSLLLASAKVVLQSFSLRLKLFNFLASKRSYSFKKIILMIRWHCMVYKIFCLFILNISNHWWRQRIEANEWNIPFKINWPYRLLAATQTLYFSQELFQFTFMLCYEYIYAMLWTKS